MISIELQPLLAAADIWQVLIGAIFFILWTVGQLLSSREEANRKKKPPRQRLQQPQPKEIAGGAPQARNQGPRNQEEALRSEVEDFLRRAQGKPEKPKPIQPQRTPQPARQSQPPRAQPPRARMQREVPADPVEIRTLRSEGIAEHVARHLSTEDIAEHTKTLGAKVAKSDDRLKSHLQEKFDHKLGSLQHRDTPEKAEPQDANLAANIAAMLSNPEGMRQLIVANEILRRPEW